MRSVMNVVDRQAPSKHRRFSHLNFRGDSTMRLETLAVHAGGESDFATGAIAPADPPGPTFGHGRRRKHRRYEYHAKAIRPTIAFARRLPGWKAAPRRLTFASGMAAISGLLESLPPDSHIVIPDDCYTGLRILRGVSAATRNSREHARHDGSRCARSLCQAGST